MQKRAIEESFPIVEINRLVVPERNGFKPIYQMHKSFAPRASCVFRAIILGALKPAGTDIMAEFYKDHTEDPDTKDKVILDTFMGGGTTIVEAARMGIRPIGIELNPVPWFVVKMALAPADVLALDAAVTRLEERSVAWSGKPLSKTLTELYENDAPFHLKGPLAPQFKPFAHAIHTYWVKSAICTSPTCRKQVPLFTDYIVADKSPSIRYQADCTCPRCQKTFDWELEPAALVADPLLMIHASTYSAGLSRSTARWTYAHPDGGLFVTQGDAKGGQSPVRSGHVPTAHVCCPHCYEVVKPRLGSLKAKRKKVPLSVLYSPKTDEVFQWRGELSSGQLVTSPLGHEFDPQKGNVPDDGEFICPHCGQRDDNIKSLRGLPEDKRFPLHAYASQAYWSAADPREEFDDETEELFGAPRDRHQDVLCVKTDNLVWKNKGKYFQKISPKQLAAFQAIETLWQEHSGNLLYPRSEIPAGDKTKSGLHAHHYRSWHHMFNERQLLALSTLLEAIKSEEDNPCRELLLLAFSGAIERNNLFCRYFNDRNTIQGSFDRHDYAPKIDPAENCVWGPAEIRGSFHNMLGRVREGLAFRAHVYDRDIDRLGEKDSLIFSSEIIPTGRETILNGDSRQIIPQIEGLVDAVITDPPYAGNVNYSELYDFFYVWLRLVLKDCYPSFLPEYTPKITEIVENKSRGLSNDDFRLGLKTVFDRASTKLKDDGLMVFTYHHSGNQQWVDLCDAVCLAGFAIEAVYPVHAEKESSLNLQNNEGISYDLIHICRKRPADDSQRRRTWQGMRHDIRRRAVEEIKVIESGRYGRDPLAPADVRMVLIGKCLELYSKNYGTVIDGEGSVLPMKRALEDIDEMVQQLITKDNPLPSELEETDVVSRVWLRALCNIREVSIDSIRKLTQGIFELSDLTDYDPPLVRKGRLKGGRTYTVLTPSERLDALHRKLHNIDYTLSQLEFGQMEDNSLTVMGPNLIDVLHYLLAHAETGERLDILVERFRAHRPQIRAALEFIKSKDPNRWAKTCDRLLPFYTDMFSGVLGSTSASIP
jgi:putative DNA methylase